MLPAEDNQRRVSSASSLTLASPADAIQCSLVNINIELHRKLREAQRQLREKDVDNERVVRLLQQMSTEGNYSLLNEQHNNSLSSSTTNINNTTFHRGTTNEVQHHNIFSDEISSGVYSASRCASSLRASAERLDGLSANTTTFSRSFRDSTAVTTKDDVCCTTTSDGAAAPSLSVRVRYEPDFFSERLRNLSDRLRWLNNDMDESIGKVLRLCDGNVN